MPLPIRPLVLAAPAFSQGTAGAPAVGWPLPPTGEIRATSNEAPQDTPDDLIALEHAVHQEHWNAAGREIYQLHAMLGEVYAETEPHIDMVAERRLALGAQAGGRPSAVAAGTVTAERAAEPGDLETSRGYPRDQYEAVQGALCDRIEATGDDAVTQNLLIAVRAAAEQQASQIGAHLSTDGEAATGGN